jgi:molecular chaperone DnaK (HSP70)
MTPPEPHYLVGIDLGTTHAVVAYGELQGDLSKVAPVLFEIEQLVGPGKLASRPLLPCLRYHAADAELSAQDIALPWSPQALAGEIPHVVIGEWARVLGSKTEGRLVSSAKSWLSHPQIEQDHACLPWGADEATVEVQKITPTLASASYLFHIRQAWNRAFPDAALEYQLLVLTVPASFDEGARTLTLRAAELAGLKVLWLLEEPQAVVYDWYASHRQSGGHATASPVHDGQESGGPGAGQYAADILEKQKLLLVCDVGGGTTDFSLISVQHQPQAEEPVKLDRIGVGDHLMLGGDNIDLALAHEVEKTISGDGRKLSSAALSQLLLQTRQAKEQLLVEPAPDAVSITVLGSGARLIGASRRAELQRDSVRELALDGFFPFTTLKEQPLRRRSAVIEFGLPYAADPAVTKHLAAFLSRHGGHSPQGLPDTLLLNGGAFNSDLLRNRIKAVLEQWRGQPIVMLENTRPNLAVAYGAVVYGLARKGAFMRIGGGSARSFFLLIESGQSRSGEAEHTGLCLLPKGAEENREYRLSGRRFALRLGQPVRFHLVSSSADMQVAGGDILQLQDLEVLSLPPLIMAFPNEDLEGTREIEVELICSLTELGTLQLSCEATESSHARWNIEFQLRKTAEHSGIMAGAASEHPALPSARGLIQAAFGKDAKGSLPLVKALRANLEKKLGKREDWDVPLSRTLFAEFLRVAKLRRLSGAHERVWLNNAGHLLRPGFGAPTDDWAIQQVWPLFSQGLAFPGESQLWSEWWTFWRRIAGGLNEAQQTAVYKAVEKYISPAALKSRKIQAEPAMKSYEDMVRLVSTLERLPVATKTETAKWLINRLQKPKEPVASWWALGRLATRVPFHGSAQQIIHRQQVEQWLNDMLTLEWRHQPEIAFAAVMMSRVSGERDQDLTEELRHRIIAALKAAKAPDSWLKMVTDKHELTEDESRRIFGEALPAGLTLL